MSVYKHAILLVLVLIFACGHAQACNYYLSSSYNCVKCDLVHSFPLSKKWGAVQCVSCPYRCPLVASNGLSADTGVEQECKPEPTAAAATATFYAIEVKDTAIIELAEVAPVAASVLSMFRAQPAIDPVDMRHNVSYFSAKPNARSVQAALNGDESGSAQFADPLADGERLRAIFRTIDDASTRDGRMTLSIEVIGDDTTERTTLVALEKVEGATLDVNLSDRQAAVYRVTDISFVD